MDKSTVDYLTLARERGEVAGWRAAQRERPQKKASREWALRDAEQQAIADGHPFNKAAAAAAYDAAFLKARSGNR